MSHVRVVVVLGGDVPQRSTAVADLVRDHGGTALLLTGYPGAVDDGLDTGEDGTVEVRTDDPTGRVESYLSGAADPRDEVLAALAAGTDGPLASVLGWEYARRAAAAAAWDLVVVELDGDLAAIRRLAAAGDLGSYVEQRWPAHVRFSAMAAGDRADTRVREAHRLAGLADDVARFLSTDVEVLVAGDDPHRTGALADLVRGAVTPDVTEDGRGGFRLSLPVPDPPSGPVTVEGGRLRVDLPGVRAALPLPALLTRCVLVDADVDPDTPAVVCDFVPDPRLWPSHLVPAGSAPRSG